MLNNLEDKKEMSEDEYEHHIGMIFEFNEEVKQRTKKKFKQQFKTVNYLDFDNLEILGRGTFGTVYRYNSTKGFQFVLKRIFNKAENEEM